MANEESTQTSLAETKAPDDRHASLSAAYKQLIDNPHTHLVKEQGDTADTLNTEITVEEQPQNPPQDVEGKEKNERAEVSKDEKHAESSRLGRHVKELRQQNDTLSQKVDNLMQLVQTLVGQKSPGNETEQQPIMAPEAIITGEDVLLTTKARADEFRKILFKGTPFEKMQAQEAYATAYRDHMYNLMTSLDDDEAMYKEVEFLITEKDGIFNEIHDLKTPVKDASKNFAGAVKKVLASKTAQPRETQQQAKLRQETAKGTGVPEVRVQSETPPARKPITDPKILEFMRRTGKSEEWVKKALEDKPQGYGGFFGSQH